MKDITKAHGRVGTSKKKYSSMLPNNPQTSPPNPCSTFLFLLRRRFKRVDVEKERPTRWAIDIYSLEYINWCEVHAFCHIPAQNQLPWNIFASLNAYYFRD